MSKLKPSKKGFLKFFMFAVFAGALASSGYFYYKYSQVKDADEVADVKKTVEAVRNLMSLPDSEVPTVATVTDKTKLVQQPFFKLAENGDKVVIYQSIKKAILYRPSTNKIVDVTPVNTEQAKRENPTQPSNVLGAQQAEAQRLSGTPVPTPDENKVYAVALLNASSTEGATNTIEAKLADVEKMKIVAKDNAQNESETSSVIAVNKDAATRAKQVADKLNYNVSSSLPNGENVPEGADIVVIIGEDGVEKGAEE